MLAKNKNSPSKVICVGRNYVAHAKELGNDVPTKPLLFIKPPSSINLSHEINIDELTQQGVLGDLHFECELCLRVGKQAKNIHEDDAFKYIDAVTLSLDLTLRDLQKELKEKGHPWERAKGFDGACVIAEWQLINENELKQPILFELAINNIVKQQGNTELMLFPLKQLISDISHVFTLEKNDIIMTGTPKGVGKLTKNDEIKMNLKTKQKTWQIAVV